jgi:hypothetical protein
MTLSNYSDGPEYKELTRCDRCGLEYEVSLISCSHCSELNEEELHAFLHERNTVTQANSNLGKFFIFVAITIIGALTIAYLL